MTTWGGLVCLERLLLRGGSGRASGWCSGSDGFLLRWILLRLLLVTVRTGSSDGRSTGYSSGWLSGWPSTRSIGGGVTALSSTWRAVVSAGAWDWLWVSKRVRSSSSRPPSSKLSAGDSWTKIEREVSSLVSSRKRAELWARKE